VPLYSPTLRRPLLTVPSGAGRNSVSFPTDPSGTSLIRSSPTFANNGSNVFTLTGWWYAPTTFSHPGVMWRVGSFGDLAWLCYVSANDGQIYVNKATFLEPTGATGVVFPIGSWVFMSYSYDLTDLHISLNGGPLVTVTGSPDHFGNLIAIGDGNQGSQGWTGWGADFRGWNDRVLSRAEINDEMRSISPVQLQGIDHWLPELTPQSCCINWARTDRNFDSVNSGISTFSFGGPEPPVPRVSKPRRRRRVFVAAAAASLAPMGFDESAPPRPRRRRLDERFVEPVETVATVAPVPTPEETFRRPRARRLGLVDADLPIAPETAPAQTPVYDAPETWRRHPAQARQRAAPGIVLPAEVAPAPGPVTTPEETLRPCLPRQRTTVYEEPPLPSEVAPAPAPVPDDAAARRAGRRRMPEEPAPSPAPSALATGAGADEAVRPPRLRVRGLVDQAPPIPAELAPSPGPIPGVDEAIRPPRPRVRGLVDDANPHPTETAPLPAPVPDANASRAAMRRRGAEEPVIPPPAGVPEDTAIPRARLRPRLVAADPLLLAETAPAPAPLPDPEPRPRATRRSRAPEDVPGTAIATAALAVSLDLDLTTRPRVPRRFAQDLEPWPAEVVTTVALAVDAGLWRPARRRTGLGEEPNLPVLASLALWGFASDATPRAPARPHREAAELPTTSPPPAPEDAAPPRIAFRRRPTTADPDLAAAAAMLIADAPPARARRVPLRLDHGLALPTQQLPLAVWIDEPPNPVSRVRRRWRHAWLEIDHGPLQKTTLIPVLLVMSRGSPGTRRRATVIGRTSRRPSK